MLSFMMFMNYNY